MNSDQLELWPLLRTREDALPWGGKSPRVLTASYARSILKAQAAKKLSGTVCDPYQVDMFVQPQRSPVYDGASPLIPLPWE